jgi:hypothetical protein
MGRANYLIQSISICCATLRKLQRLLKDKAKKILFSRGIRKSSPQSLYHIFIKAMTHKKTAHF